MKIATIVDHKQLVASYRDAIYSMRQYRSKIKGNHGNCSGCGFLKMEKKWTTEDVIFRSRCTRRGQCYTTQTVKTISTEI